MEVTNEMFSIWQWMYNKIHYYPYEEFLKNLCDFEYLNIFSEKEATVLVERFKIFKKKKIKDLCWEKGDIRIIQVIDKGEKSAFSTVLEEDIN